MASGPTACATVGCTLFHPNGEMYEGEWRHGRMHGVGKLVSANGETYEGQWMENKARARARARARRRASGVKRARHAHERRARLVCSLTCARSTTGRGASPRRTATRTWASASRAARTGRGVLAMLDRREVSRRFAHNQVLLRCPRVARGHRVCVCLDAAPSSHSRARARSMRRAGQRHGRVCIYPNKSKYAGQWHQVRARRAAPRRRCARSLGVI